MTVAVSCEPGDIQKAAVHLLGLSAEEIRKHAANIVADHVTQAIAESSAEDLQKNRAALITQVKTAATEGLASLGIRFVAMTIKSLG